MDSAHSNDRPVTSRSSGRDKWQELSRYTNARIALGHSGGSLRTETVLELRLAHARARDAVWKNFEADKLQRELQAAGFDTCRLTTRTSDRQTFLLRPELGRKLSNESRQFLIEKRSEWGQRELAVIVSDGLSPLAAEAQARLVLIALFPRLLSAGWKMFPVFIVPFGRVKLQDEIGELLCARQTLILLGERPGLGSPDSLGAYLTYGPNSNRTDADRNCVSNIRPD